MHTATVICNTPRAASPSQIGGRAQGTSESTGDEPQQRFADVLPLAQAAADQASDDTPAESPSPEGSAEGQTVAESAGQGDASTPDEQDASADTQAVVWPFAGIVQPPIQRQAGADAQEEQAVQTPAVQQAAAAAFSSQTQKLPEQVQTPQGVAVDASNVQSPPDAGSETQGMAVDAGPVAARPPAQKTQATPQTSVTEPPMAARPATTTASDAPIAGGQEVPSPAATRQTVPEGRPVPTAQAPADRTGVDPGTVQSEQTPAPAVSEAADQAPQGNGQQASAPADSASGDPLTAGEETTGQVPAKTQQTNSRQTADLDRAVRSEKRASNPAPAVDGRTHETSESAAPVASDSPIAAQTQAQAKDTVVSQVKDAGTASPEFRVAAGGESVTAPRPAAVSTQSQTNVEAPSVRTPAQSVGDQILDSIRSSGSPGEREVFIRLHPPELGTVVVRFQERGDNLTGTLEVSTREARREIEQALPQVVRGLQEAGVMVRRVEVVTSDQSERNPGGEHLPQDSWQQHQGTGQGREHSSASPHNRWSQAFGERGSAHRAISGEGSQTAATPGRIDVLL